MTRAAALFGVLWLSGCAYVGDPKPPVLDIPTRITDLRAIDPPGEVSALHRRLVAAIAAYGREIRRERSVLRSGDPRALVSAQQRLLRATTMVSRSINATIAAINRALKGC